MTNKMFIAINGVHDVTEFVKQAAATGEDIVCTRGRWVVDGCSLLGIMSIDTSLGFTVEYPEKAKGFENFISQFKVN